MSEREPRDSFEHWKKEMTGTPDTPPRPEPMATADLALRLRTRAATSPMHLQGLLADAADALEDTAAERDRLASDLRECDAALTEAEMAYNRVEAERDRAHETLREICKWPRSGVSAAYLARERIENP